MYKINDEILYGIHGLCQIKDISIKKFGKNNCQYYVLKQIYNEGNTIYVPTDNLKLLDKMHAIVTVDEAKKILASKKEAQEWIENDRQRYDAFQNILCSGNRKDMIQIIQSLNERRLVLKEKKRKLLSNDEMLLEEAEKIIGQEFSYVLDLPYDEIIKSIQK